MPVSCLVIARKVRIEKIDARYELKFYSLIVLVISYKNGMFFIFNG